MRRFFLFYFLYLISASLFAQDKPEGLFINSKAPDIRTTDQFGRTIRLREIIKDSNVVLFFYRGCWDPYSIRNLKRLNDSLSYFQRNKIKLIAVSPERPDSIFSTMQKANTDISIISDKDLKIMKAYAVGYEVDDRSLARYKNAGVDLLAVNKQKDKAWLPVPAIYFINKDETIFYRYFEEDYKKWPTLTELIDNLK